MKQASYTVSFLTPAFLGNAEQSGQWRSPPFKALLRQWWRVVYAAENNFQVDIAAMRTEEGRLFGVAADGAESRKSQIRIRLTHSKGQGEPWLTGTQQGVAPLSTGLDTSYAWFGLIKRGNGLPDRSGIKAGQAESSRLLELAFPEQYEQTLFEVMTLIDAFGLVGSRSRGGWGALQLESNEEPLTVLSASQLKAYARPLDRCLADDWAMSLAKDDAGLCIWESMTEFDTWDKAMRFIAINRKTVRMALKQGKDLRPALGFASTGRMPSPLRWKVMVPKQGKLQVRAVALPHRIPDDGGKHLAPGDLQQAWNTVTRTLDNIPAMQRWQ
ncbi:MAG: hypothetical protein RQ715_11855 [Methylococcales bacterium]|nr:hypothetical protein [Methylococcales bacterium]